LTVISTLVRATSLQDLSIANSGFGTVCVLDTLDITGKLMNLGRVSFRSIRSSSSIVFFFQNRNLVEIEFSVAHVDPRSDLLLVLMLGLLNPTISGEVGFKARTNRINSTIGRLEGVNIRCYQRGLYIKMHLFAQTMVGPYIDMVIARR
jgi:hypothetical protein